MPRSAPAHCGPPFLPTAPGSCSSAKGRARGLAFDPSTGTIYGCFYDELVMGYEFGTLDPGAGTRSKISTIEMAPWLGCACDTDGELWDEKECQRGEEVSVSLFCWFTGTQEYKVVMNAGGHDSYARTVTVWIGPDTPQAPVPALERQGDVNHITWTLPEGGVHGGYVNAQDVTYTVTHYPDSVKVAQSIRELCP